MLQRSFHQLLPYWVPPVASWISVDHNNGKRHVTSTTAVRGSASIGSRYPEFLLDDAWCLLFFWDWNCHIEHKLSTNDPQLGLYPLMKSSFTDDPQLDKSFHQLIPNNGHPLKPAQLFEPLEHLKIASAPRHAAAESTLLDFVPQSNFIRVCPVLHGTH